MNITCKIRTDVGGPVQILAFNDRESSEPAFIYCLNEQGYIVRGSQQKPLTQAEIAALDEAAERAAEEHRAENAGVKVSGDKR